MAPTKSKEVNDDLYDWCEELVSLVKLEDGPAIRKHLAKAHERLCFNDCLNRADSGIQGVVNLTFIKQGAQMGMWSKFVQAYILHLKARRNHDWALALEHLVTAERAYTELYVNSELLSSVEETSEELHDVYFTSGDSFAWFVPPFIEITSQTRHLAIYMDNASDQDRWCMKLVEVARELFPKLLKERRRKMTGACWLSSELLRLFQRLDQVALCGPILAAVEQQYKAYFTPTALPKSVAVTLYFHWGKYLVTEQRFGEAAERLNWALDNCCEEHNHNRRRIAQYLIPCNLLARGFLPKRSMLREYGLENEYQICLEHNTDEYVKAGTYMVMEKLLLVLYRNLAKRVYLTVDPASCGYKMDLDYFDTAWQVASSKPPEIVESSSVSIASSSPMSVESEEHQVHCPDSDEVQCSLAGLIYIQAIKTSEGLTDAYVELGQSQWDCLRIKGFAILIPPGSVWGYLSYEHNKFVFSKQNAFPPIDKWKW
ncbi:PCI domain-containing protein 2 [Perkinsus chesapeaki]|uniref:PCI domain-containing protein 2 n=1 Tax=Perkinsus chesapeaki TaxID=330153 RepID=A0A7J6MNP1_PERCH|nr:PCI domain-containing protein 2 [Perkinsus chesapeaki]